MAEKESKFVLSMASAVHALINVAERQQAIVDAALKETREAARQTSEAARLSRKAADELPLQVIVALDRVSEGTATRAATLLAEKFTQADTQAYQAAQRYERAARSLSWRLVVAASVFGAVLLTRDGDDLTQYPFRRGNSRLAGNRCPTRAARWAGSRRSLPRGGEAETSMRPRF